MGFLFYCVCMVSRLLWPDFPGSSYLFFYTIIASLCHISLLPELFLLFLTVHGPQYHHFIPTPDLLFLLVALHLSCFTHGWSKTGDHPRQANTLPLLQAYSLQFFFFFFILIPPSPPLWQPSPCSLYFWDYFCFILFIYLFF